MRRSNHLPLIVLAETQLMIKTSLRQYCVQERYRKHQLIDSLLGGDKNSQNTIFSEYPFMKMTGLLILKQTMSLFLS